MMTFYISSLPANATVVVVLLVHIQYATPWHARSIFILTNFILLYSLPRNFHWLIFKPSPFLAPLSYIIRKLQTTTYSFDGSLHFPLLSSINWFLLWHTNRLTRTRPSFCKGWVPSAIILPSFHFLSVSSFLFPRPIVKCLKKGYISGRLRLIFPSVSPVPSFIHL